MKSDTIKVIVAVVLLAIAGIVIVMQFGGGAPERPQGEGDVFDPNVEYGEGETPAMIR